MNNIDDNRHKHTADKELRDLTIGVLISRLKISQFWGVLVAVTGLISATFFIGKSVSDNAHKNTISGLNTRLNTQIETQKTESERYRGLETKERIISLYCRYLLTAQSGDLRVKEIANEAFENAVFEAWRLHRTSPNGAQVEVRGIILGKGSSPGEATMKFVYDQTIWPLPYGSSIAIE